MRRSDLLAHTNCSNRTMFCAEVCDVFPVPASVSLDFVSCVLSIKVIVQHPVSRTTISLPKGRVSSDSAPDMFAAPF
jgi:hypothetical protein